VSVKFGMRGLNKFRSERIFKVRVAGRRQPDFAVPFICGATRSGTTLLRLMLDSHPELAIPGETHFIVPLVRAMRKQRLEADQLADLIVEGDRWGDFHLDEAELRQRLRALSPLTAADAVREFFGLYAERQGKVRWGDKTPGYVQRMRLIERVLPEARFIHIIRDGRDVALSVVPRSWGPATVQAAAENWKLRIDRARRQAPHLKHYLEVHYEDLITDTEGVLRQICEFIELDFDPAMLSYHERASERLAEKARDLSRPWGTVSAESRVESHKLASEPPREDRIARWKTLMSEEDRLKYEAIAGQALEAVGYEVGVSVDNPAAEALVQHD
jgi:sulfotransferase family protein